MLSVSRCLFACLLLIISCQVLAQSQSLSPLEEQMAGKALAVAFLYSSVFELDDLYTKMQRAGGQRVTRPFSDCFSIVHREAFVRGARLAEMSARLDRGLAAQGVSGNSEIRKMMLDFAGLARASRFVALGLRDPPALAADPEFRLYLSLAPVIRAALPQALAGLRMTEQDMKVLFAGVFYPVFAELCPSL